MPDLMPRGLQTKSAPAELSASKKDLKQDLFSQGHSRLYERRKEIERELRREFNMEEEAEYRMGADEAPMRKGPAPFGRPPPVPRPRQVRTVLPPIPKPAEGPRPRWGVIDEPAGNQDAAGEPEAQEAKERWWQREREELQRQRNSEDIGGGGRGLSQPPPPPPPGGHEAGAAQGDPRVVQPPVQSRPRSWRLAAEPSGQEETPEWRGVGRRAPSPPCAPSAPSSASPSPQAKRQRATSSPAEDTPSRRPHVEKARELEELARELRQQNEESRKRAAKLKPQSPLSQDGEQQPVEEKSSARRKAEQDERLEREARDERRRLRREAEDVAQHRRAQEEWERDFRSRLSEEEAQRQHSRKAEQREDDRQQQQAQADMQREMREREERRRQEQEQEESESERLRAKAEENRRRMAEQAAAAQRKAQKEAERVRQRLREQEEAARRRSAQSQADPGQHAPPPPPPPPPRPPRSDAGPAEGSRPGPGGTSRWRSASTPASPSKAAAQRDSQEKLHTLRQAEAAAMQEMQRIARLPQKEVRQKAYKDLLRAWHPDKNPSNAEVATAVFQRIQSERAKVLGK